MAAVSLFSTFLLISLSCGIDKICAIGSCVKIAPITAVLTLLFSLSQVFAKPDIGAISELCTATVNGALWRSMTALLLSLPPLLWLRSYIVSTKLVNEATGWGAFGLTVLFMCGGLVYRINRQIGIDAERTRLAFEIKLQEAAATSQTSQRLGLSSVPSVKLRLVCMACGQEYQDQTLTHCPSDSSVLSKIASDDLVDTIFAERYRITEQLGQGGMSIVYKAQHTLLPNQYAIKVLRHHLEADKQSILRFHREAKATSTIVHPNVIGVHDFGMTREGKAFIVMEYVQGRSLREHIKSTGPMPFAEAIDMIIQICDGLACAHDTGIVHRDLKPANVMLVEENGQRTAKVVDFGLAKASNGDDLHVTTTGEILGSPLYMSPEQCMGLSLDARSDVYSLGCMTYECLTGRAPFSADTAMEMLQHHIQTRPQPLGESHDIPEWLSMIVFRMLEKRPESRYSSTRELKAHLEQGMRSRTTAMRAAKANAATTEVQKTPQ